MVVLDLVPGGLAVEGGAAEELHRVRPAQAREARVTHVSLWFTITLAAYI